MSKIRLLTLAIAIATAGVIGSVASAQTFSDVPPSHPFFEEIEWMADTGISTGYTDGTYRPGTAVTRQAMSAFMQRLAENLLPRVAHASDMNVFTLGVGEAANWAVSIQAPSAGYLVMAATADITGGSGTLICELSTVGHGIIPDSRMFQDVGGERVCSTSSVIPVEAGEHEVWLIFDGTALGDPVNLYAKNVTVTWFPYDGLGNPPLLADIAADRSTDAPSKASS